MKLFYNKEFEGLYPVGTAAIVVAKDSTRAAQMLQAELEDKGMHQTVLPSSMVEFKGNKELVIIVNDGDY